MGHDQSSDSCSYRGIIAAMAALFKDEELRDLSGLKKGEDFVEVTCGCTSRKYGDSVGKLRVYADGQLGIDCDCYPGCPEGNLTPAAFEKHAVKEAPSKWKYNIWVMINGKKVPIVKTSLLKYHDRASKAAGSSRGQQRAQHFHRDEFIKCSECSKQRRFRLQTKEECRIYHDALADRNWTCAKLPFEFDGCDDDEERASRKQLRGCPHAAACEGCIVCVCTGCELCCFADCNCRMCVDFLTNADL